LPEGAQLRSIDDDVEGAVAVQRGDQRLALITPPSAFDAEGEALPAAFAIEGDRLVVRFAHRDRDVAYPLLVDPVIDNYQVDPNGTKLAPNDNFAGWRYLTNASGSRIAGHKGYGDVQGNGLYVWTHGSATNPVYYNHFEYGQWIYDAPRQSFVERADFGYVTHVPNGASTCVVEGIYAPSRAAYDEGWWYHPPGQAVLSGSSPWLGYQGAGNANSCETLNNNYKAHCVAGDCGVPNATRANLANFGLVMNGSGYRTTSSYTFMYGAVLWQYDYDTPQLTNAAPASSNGFVDDGAKTYSLGASGREPDPGLGVYAFQLFKNGQPENRFINSSGGVSGTTSSGACTGTRFARCPTSASADFSYTLPEGANSLGLVVYDILGKSSAQTWTTKIDRSKPDVNLSGRLVDNDDKTVSEAAYGLRVSATDGVQGGSASQQRSGVRSIEVLVDDKRVEYAEQACSQGSCPLETTYSFRPDDFKHGKHTIQAITTDQLGHRTESKPIKVTVDHDAGELGHFKFEDQQLFDRGDLRVNVSNGNLIVHGGDVKIAGLGINLAIDRFYNSRESQTASEFGHGWNLNTGASLRLDETAEGPVRLHGPSGYIVTFTKKGTDGDFNTPRGVKAELKKGTDGAYTLTIDASKEEYRFGSDGRLIRHEDKNDRSTTFQYDAEGRVVELTDTRGRVVRFGYQQGRLASITDSSGRTWGYGYDAAGDLRTYTDPAGGVTRYDYDAQHRLERITDPRGAATTVAYDDPYRRVRSITRDGRTTRFAYDTPTDKCDATDKPTDATQVTDARGNTTTFCADEDDQVLRVKDALNRKRGSGYDTQGNVTSTTSATGNSTSSQFEGRDLKSSTSATGASNTFEYEAPSNPHQPSKATNAQGNSLTYTYDGQGNLESTAASNKDTAAETLVTLDYNKAADEDPEGTLKSSTDGNDHTTTYDYDDQGHLREEDPPGDDQGKITYRYDALSRPIAVRDGKGQLRTIDYDALDRVVKITYADGTSVGYSYDQNGNRTERRDQTGTTSYAYDARNQKLEERLPGGAVNTYGYDGVGNLLSISDQGGTVGYTYNEVNLLTALTEPGGAQTTFRYTDDNQRELTILPNGVQQKVVFDKDERVQDLRARKGSDGELITDLEYDYKSPAGSATNARHSVQDGLTADTTTYGYDFLNRLKQAKTTDDSSGETVDDYRYTYDRNSNRRLSETHNGETINYEYNQNNELQNRDMLGGTGQVTYDYDQNGNLTSSSAGLQMDYNAANQTTQIRPPDHLADSGALADLTQPRIDLAYAGQDQTERVKKGDLSFQHNALGLGREQDTTQATHYIRDNQGKLIGLRRGGQSAYYLTDSIGTVLAVTGPDASVDARYTYDPFGQVKDVKGDLAQPYRFAGEYYDAETRFYKSGLRYYDPKTARFTQNDPIVGFSDPRRANRYIYAGQDPINNIDPTGALFDEVGGDGLFGAFVQCLNPVSHSALVGGAAGGVSGFAAGAVAGLPSGPGAVGTGLVSGAAGATLGYGIGKHIGCAESVLSADGFF